MRTQTACFTALTGLVLSTSGVAFGQAPPAAPAAPPTVAADAGGAAAKAKTEAIQSETGSKRPEGWTPGIALGGTFNVVDTRSVVGQQDGTSLTFGGAVDAILEFNSGIHEWRNTLRAAAGATRTPALDEFVKTSDGLAVESIHLMHLLEWLGPYARVAMNTQMFPSLDIRPGATDYTIARLDGSTDNLRGRRLYLTDAFAPVSLRQSIGAFVQPVKEDSITLEARAGAGAQETFVAGNLAVTDDAATPVVEVSELDDFYKIGAEGIVNAWGFFDEGKRVSYTVGIGVLVPFVTSDLADGDDRSLPELTSVEGLAGLNVKLFDWASLGYNLRVVRDPLLVDAWQVSNNLLLTIGAAFGSKAPEPPPPPPCDCKEEVKKAVEAATAPPAAPASAPTPATPAPAQAPAPARAPGAPSTPAPAPATP